MTDLDPRCPIHGYQGLLPSSSCPLAHYRNGRIEACGQPLTEQALTGASAEEADRG